MKCPVCIKEGTTSTVQSLGGTRTLMGWTSYYDEEGNPHDHDPNATSSDYRCSNGHGWSVSSKGSCWCGWSGGETTTMIYKGAT